eukprot:CAMPEP_0173437616 /NCGR_PEP_ID=MMETSP1357-20121228/18124_1 /TAXON_ID=77926 /ORGANISM="Hemiselmis rufescens, Strain PCC563" /LENGTH=43 /DNA_ID= /DNA_START= /DNA_END= /DNA_ORIENTATION=
MSNSTLSSTCFGAWLNTSSLTSSTFSHAAPPRSPQRASQSSPA